MWDLFIRAIADHCCMPGTLVNTALALYKKILQLWCCDAKKNHIQCNMIILCYTGCPHILLDRTGSNTPHQQQHKPFVAFIWLDYDGNVERAPLWPFPHLISHFCGLLSTMNKVCLPHKLSVPLAQPEETLLAPPLHASSVPPPWKSSLPCAGNVTLNGETALVCQKECK